MQIGGRFPDERQGVRQSAQRLGPDVIHRYDATTMGSSTDNSGAYGVDPDIPSQPRSLQQAEARRHYHHSREDAQNDPVLVVVAPGRGQ